LEFGGIGEGTRLEQADLFDVGHHGSHSAFDFNISSILLVSIQLISSKMIVIFLLLNSISLAFSKLLKEVDKPFNLTHEHTSLNALHGDGLFEDYLIALGDNSD